MGGRGGLLGPLLGSACIYLLQSLLAALQVPQTWLKVTYGLLLLAAVIFGSLIESTGKGAKR
jgi:ribose/xylose/arabinose/galactoside ABC-type transport system permease subunit